MVVWSTRYLFLDIPPFLWIVNVPRDHRDHQGKNVVTWVVTVANGAGSTLRHRQVLTTRLGAFGACNGKTSPI